MALERLPVIKDAQLYQRPMGSPFLPLGEEEPMPAMDMVASEAPPVVPQVSSDEERRMQELDRMLQEAQSRADMLERETYDKAYAAGEQSGFALGQKRAEQTLEQMTQLLSQAEMQLGSLDYMCREAVLDVAEAVVKQVLGGLEGEQHKLLLQAAERAAFQFPELHDLVLLVHPNDMQSFEDLLPESGLDMARLRADQTVEEGSCRLMSEHQDALIHPNQALHESFALLRQQVAL